jgi:uncharacterized protein (TIGR02145 family)
MKKSILLVLIIFVFLKSPAQNYLISFAGVGDTTAIAIVKVYNLTSGDSATLNDGDILHLKPANGIAMMGNDEGILKIHPNPMKDKSLLAFVAPGSGIAVISVLDVNGKTVSQISTFLFPGTNNFQISGIKQGIYLVTVSGPGYNYSAKLVSQNNSESQARIESFSPEKVQLKMKTDQPKSKYSTVDMPYTQGDILLYKSISGQYSTIVTDIPTGSKTVTFQFAACRDSDNHTYPILQVGAQTWMAANLNAGARIQDTTNQNSNGVVEKYCYENNEANCNVYGGLYQWGEMMSYDTIPGSRGICPAGWHIPTNAEWTTLMTYLGGDSAAGGKMKETGFAHWASPNTGATNSSGFTALPGGYRYYSGTLYMTDYAVFWSSNESGTSNAWYLQLQFNYVYVTRRAYTKANGYSVRCLKN